MKLSKRVLYIIYIVIAIMVILAMVIAFVPGLR